MGDACAMADVLMGAWQEFSIDRERFGKIVEDFAEELEAGLSGRKSSLAMMPAFIGRPSGRERGVYLSLDFGGTNVRVAEVALDGAGFAFIRRMHKVSLWDAAAGYDYTRPEVHVTELFDFLASQVALLYNGESRSLGHSFSFVSRQTSLARAGLMGWAKEIRTGGMAGQDIGELLETSLARLGIHDVRQVAVLNDTIATLLTVAYSDGDADLGSVCGTGHNTCHYEPQLDGSALAYNAESGGFNRLEFTEYDIALDAASDHPGRQRLEKMTSGRYLGEVTRRMAQAGSGECGLAWLDSCPALRDLDGLSSQDVALFLSDESSDLSVIENWLSQKAPGVATAIGERHFLREAAVIASGRAATLVAATYAGFLRRIDPSHARIHTIGVNGSLYEKMPGFAAAILQSLTEKGGWDESQVKFRVVEEAPLRGAAIAAAMAETDGGRR